MDALRARVAAALPTFFGGETPGDVPAMGSRGASVSWKRQQAAATKVFDEFVAARPQGVGRTKTTKPWAERDADRADGQLYDESNALGHDMKPITCHMDFVSE